MVNAALVEGGGGGNAFLYLLGLSYKTLNRVFSPAEPGYSGREIKQETIFLKKSFLKSRHT